MLVRETSRLYDIRIELERLLKNHDGHILVPNSTPVNILDEPDLALVAAKI